MRLLWPGRQRRDRLQVHVRLLGRRWVHLRLRVGGLHLRLRERRLNRLRAVGLVIAALLLIPACGSSDDGGEASGDTRTVEVEMVDTAFNPDRLSVSAGEEVQFVFSNRGQARHEAYVGSPKEQADHESELAAGGGGHDGHGGGDDDRMVVVEPGKKKTLTYRFDDPGTFEIGCHEPGHYGAGMKITVEVS